MSDIFELRNHIKISQGNRLLEGFIANCPFRGKKGIVMRCNGIVEFPIKDAERFAEDIRKMIMVAKPIP